MTRATFLKFFLLVSAAVILASASGYLIKQFFFTSPENKESEIATNSTQISTNKTSNASTNKPNPILNDKVAKDSKLQTQSDSLLNLFDNMPSVPVFTKDEPILKTGTVLERGLAYTACDVHDNKPTIFIKKAFYEKGNQKQIVNILKHELTHAYFCRQGFQVGHDERWRKKFESIGGFGN